MRDLYLFILSTLAIPAQAQLWERADQRDEEISLERVLPIGGGRWAVIGRGTFAGSHLISVRDGEGSIVWEDLGQYVVSHGPGDVILMPDSGLLHVGVYDGCDYYGSESRVRRYAPDGSILWENVIDPQFSSQVTMAAKGSIAHVALAAQDSVYILDLNGNSDGGFEVPSNDVHMILWASDSSLFIVRGTDLQYVDLGGTVLASTPIGPLLKDMHWDGQQLFVLSNDSVRRFDASLVPTGSAALPGVSGITASDSNLYVNTSTALYQLDANGVPNLLFPWPVLPNLTTTACAVRNDTVLSVGNTSISGRSTGVVRTLSIGGDAALHDEDVELLLQVDSAWSEFVGGWYPWNRRAEITGLVVNRGSDTLNSVVVSMWVSVPYIFCNIPTNRIDTTGLVLAPGDTLILPFGVVDVAMGLTNNQVMTLTDEICIVALAPDRLADRGPDDNAACETLTFPLGMGTGFAPPSLSLVPNPTTDRCVLTGLASLGTAVQVRLMDLSGRSLVYRSVSSSSNSLELDVSDLSPETYIICMEGERNRAVMKLVVVRP